MTALREAAASIRAESGLTGRSRTVNLARIDAAGLVHVVHAKVARVENWRGPARFEYLSSVTDTIGLVNIDSAHCYRDAEAILNIAGWLKCGLWTVDRRQPACPVRRIVLDAL